MKKGWVWRRTVGGAIVLALTLGAWWLTAWVDGTRLESPDSDHVAVTQTRRFRALTPAMPGQGGDKPGRLAVLSPTGNLCGTLELPLINMAYDAEWSATQLTVRLLGAVPLCD